MTTRQQCEGATSLLVCAEGEAIVVKAPGVVAWRESSWHCSLACGGRNATRARTTRRRPQRDSQVWDPLQGSSSRHLCPS
jgi:actin-like ATPase involved in cell morphogenesis